MIHIAIIEDEKSAAALLSEFVKRYFKEEKKDFSCDTFHSGSEMLMNFRSQFDIILMDVRMPGMDGMETARALRKIDENFCLIFVTNMANTAIHGYEVNAIDFLVKPITYFQFKHAMQKAINICISNSSSFIMLDVNSTEKRKVLVKDLIYVEIFGHILTYHFFDETLEIPYITMKKAKSQLEGMGFARCNNCYLVNMRYITAITKNSVTVNGIKLKMSRTRREQFMLEFTRYLGECR